MTTSFVLPCLQNSYRGGDWYFVFGVVVMAFFIMKAECGEEYVDRV